MRGKRKRRGGQFKDLKSGLHAFRAGVGTGIGDIGHGIGSLGRDAKKDTKGLLSQSKEGVDRLAGIGHGALDVIGRQTQLALGAADSAVAATTKAAHGLIDTARKKARGGRKSRRHRGGSRRTRRRKGGRRRTRRRGGKRRRSRRGGRQSRRRMRGGGCGCGGRSPLVGGRRGRR